MADLLLFAPELALLLLGLALFFCPVLELSYRVTWSLAMAAGVVALGVGLWTLELAGAPFAPGIYAVDFFSQFVKVALALGYLLVVAISRRPQTLDRATWLEFPMLLLFATVGTMMMVSATELLTLYIAMELAAYPLYIVVALHREPQVGGESSTKYMLQGMVASAISLYGMSLLFGVCGTTYFSGIAAGLSQTAGQPLMWIGFLLLLAGFFFKLAVVPFHFWTPDVYEGAPTPVTTFLAVASKAAGFGALLRFLHALFMADGVREAVVAYGERIGLLLAILAAVTMTLGNLGALRQKSVKRMLAYSSIAHAGYVLMGLVSMETAGFQASMFYLAAYYFMNLGAFGFLVYFQGVTGSDTYESLKGLGWKAPLVSVAMVVFLVSLTGLPPTVGFYGKYLLFQEAISGGFAWLAVVAGINSVISLFYYMRVAKMLFLAEPSEETPAPQPAFTGLVAALGVLTVLFGIYTAPIQDWVRASFG